MVMKIASILIALVLVNCGPGMNNDTIPFPPWGEDACGAEQLAHLIGQPVPDAAALAAIEGPARIRVIRPGQAVTMDHAPARLNIELDKNDIVARLRCG